MMQISDAIELFVLASPYRQCGVHKCTDCVAQTGWPAKAPAVPRDLLQLFYVPAAIHDDGPLLAI